MVNITYIEYTVRSFTFEWYEGRLCKYKGEVYSTHDMEMFLHLPYSMMVQDIKGLYRPFLFLFGIINKKYFSWLS